MKYSKLLSFLFISLLIAFSSCKKEEISEMNDVIEPTPQEQVTTNPLIPQMQMSVMNPEGLDLGCFSVDFPFDLLVDGTTYTIEGSEDFEDALFESAESVEFVYPINITYPLDGTTASIADAEEFGAAFANCIPDTNWGENSFPAFLISAESSCYEFVYPVNLVDTEDNTVTANDEDELVDLLSAGDILFFQFPVSLLHEDGSTLSAENDEELFGLLFECEEIEIPGGDPINDCWETVYPFNMLDQDGNIVVINNHDDICNAMLNGLELDYTFPLTLVNGAGEELIVNNMEELEQAWFDCFPDFEGVDLDLQSFIFNSDFIDGQDCYAVIYPLTYTNTDTEETNTLDDAAAAQAYTENMTGNEFWDVVIFPVTVIELETGNEVTIDNMQAYFEFLITCG